MFSDKSLFTVIAFLTLFAGVFGWRNLYAEESNQQKRDAAQKTMKAGNFKDAYAQYSALAMDPKDDPLKVGEDLANGINCLTRLGREDEVDDFREKIIEVHANNWRLLAKAAETLTPGQHIGFIVAGKFYRGNRRGNDGRYVSSYARDRVRALQLLSQAMDKGKDEPDKKALSQFYTQAAHALNPQGYHEAWRLQDLTELDKLPDYEDGYNGNGRGYYRGGYSGVRGAPTNPDGTPVYYKIPKSFKDAANDGERWRFCLMQAEELNPDRAAELRYTFAQFLQTQFDVRTMAGYGIRSGDEKDESGPFAVKTLGEDETIAKLATGIKRFKLPDEFNFIKIYINNADQFKGNGFANQSLQALAQLFEDRQQYDRAVEFWKRSIAEYGPKKELQARVDQILNNWGTFENVGTQTPAEPATVEYRFRNGNKVNFEATEIDVTKLLNDVKAYIKTKPKQLNWENINIDNIGWRLVEKNQTQYLGAKAANWELDLQPREKHFDKRVTIETPLKKAGAYLLTAQMANGNLSRIVIWIADTAIVKKQLDRQEYFFIADAETGKSVPNAKLDFFGYQQHWNNNGYDITTSETSAAADGEGQLFMKENTLPQNHNWLITATASDGRMAFMGFTGVWYGQWYDQEYNQVKSFGITDRPVYRPDQSVKFKFWTGNAKYDEKGPSSYAGRSQLVEIHNPKGEKIFEKVMKCDEFGGLDGEIKLDKLATLGVYNISTFIGENEQTGGAGNVTFRLEEYKKPEFEVKVDAPSEPVMLGEKIGATITAKYYFGAPVAQGKVKYKILRSDHEASFYPVGAWDWFYEPGYWWFAFDYRWYPGWREWGMRRPIAWWWGHASTPPEVVSENEVPLNADGTFKIEIDTAVAKAVHGDTDHKYEITAEVTDNSRRTIVGTGSVIVARKPFKVYAWVNRGHFRADDAIEGDFSAQTVDNKPVKGKGELKLLQISYDKDGKPSEKTVQTWALDTNDEGKARQQMKAAQPGQYRLSYTVTDEKKHSIEGGYVFVVTGEGYTGAPFRFNDIELIPEKREYAPGEKVRLMVNANRENTTVLLFPRAANGICVAPKLIHLKGKSSIEELDVAQRDMPNFFVEALVVSGGKVFSETKEIVVPPESRVTNVEVLPDTKEYKPGQKAKVRLKLTDNSGEPISGTTAITVYDKSVEYISGGSNVGEIKSYFWKRRNHYPQSDSSLNKSGYNVHKTGEIAMSFLGAFGNMVADDPGLGAKPGFGGGAGRGSARGEADAFADGAVMEKGAAMPAAPTSAFAANGAMAGENRRALRAASDKSGGAKDEAEQSGQAEPMAEATVRKNFADTAFWAATLNTNAQGIAEFDVPMPESLTTWKVKVWTMSAGTRVGQGDVEVITKKNVIIRLQAPRFFTQKDEVVLSANVHNFLKEKKKVEVSLELDGGCIEAMDALKRSVEIEANAEARVDWRVKVVAAGEAVIRAKALTNEESDAMELKFPAYIHGMLKTESFSGNIRPEKDSGSIAFTVPAERRVADSRLEVRYSPTLAGAMVDALPYMVDYPYGCTEQTLNRFLPAAITQKVLLRMNINLKDVRDKITNLNAQEIGNDVERAKQWQQKNYHNPVFDDAEVRSMVQAGVDRLAAMQCGDGGWGWFSGNGEYSYPHTTAYVVHGLQIAKNNGINLPQGMLDRGVQWLKNYRDKEAAMIRNGPAKIKPYKESADNMDAFTYMVLADANDNNIEMRDFLYRDRNNLAVYGKAMFGLALNKQKQAEQLRMIMQNIEQYLVQDDENQTAYLKLPENNYWWYWYGSEYEAQAYYLKLLAAADPKSEKASRLVKYLLNNRRHATYWNSTRDTAICIEALAEYLTASGEDAPDMQLDVVLDGKVAKTVSINSSNLFTFDNKVVLTGDAITNGAHKLEFHKKGTGPLYFNAYMTNFTLEDDIKKAGLEIKVDRKYYKLTPVEKKIKVEGEHGQSVAQKVEKYERSELPNLAQLKSGDLVEIELEIDSKNDYEYILFEDMKAAGFEPVEVRSGYNGNDLNAYMELRDERVCLFARTLSRGKHSVTYRMRAEIPGTFSALPTKASAMYAPELKANSDEIKLKIAD
ncbi:MAG TPA: alpha-2-macroglobulin family protein [Planctomycetota bacterium]|nr:alpha-2-macroglobulin family protein [Planctomycetota bacterium]